MGQGFSSLAGRMACIAAFAPALVWAETPPEGWREAPPLFGAPDPVAAPPAAPPVPSEVPSAQAAIASATGALASGAYGKAARLAFAGATAWPDHAASFALVHQLALARLEPSSSSAPVIAPATPAPVEASGLAAPVRAPEPVDPHATIPRIGLDVGLPIGLRMDWVLDRRRVESVGFRAGLNVATRNGWPQGVFDTSGFVDLYVGDDPRWQLEISQVWLPAPGVGVALQFDPEGPFQVQGGAKASVEGAVAPEASVSWMWRRRR